MHWPHDPFVENCNVHEELIERNVLLGISPNQIVKLQASNGQHGLAIELGIVESIQQVNAARTGGGQADSQLAGEFGIAAGHERSRLFMAHLDEPDLLLVSA